VDVNEGPVNFRSDWLWLHNILPSLFFLVWAVWAGLRGWLLWILLAALAFAVVTVLRTRLTIHGSSIEIVNAFRSWKVVADEIAFFEQPTRPRLDTNRMVSTAHLRDGREIRVYALSRPQWFRNGRAAKNLHHTIAGLNLYVARHGGGPPTPGASPTTGLAR
jgi:hypothetical protein